jgi:type II secretory pathway pseudopilin PulG
MTAGKKHDFFSDNRGFTLIEAIVSVGIFALIVGSIVAMLLFSWKAKSVVWEQLGTQNEGRKVVQDFVNEVRTAAASNVGAYPVALAQSQQIIFYSDADKDSLRERIRYFLDGRTLKKGITKPTSSPPTYDLSDEVVAEIVHDVANGTSSVFSYYNDSFTGTEPPMSYPVSVTDVRMVGISLVMDENPQITPAPFFIESKAMLRSYKSN